MEYIDISDKQITKRQHYVPKAYLKNFAIEDQGTPQVYAVFSEEIEAKLVSIDNICCRNYLYDQIAIDPESNTHIFVAPNEIEDSFIQLEGEYAAIVSKMKEALLVRNDFELSTPEIGKIKIFMSLLIWRNPIFIHILKCTIDRLYNQDLEHIEATRNKFPDIPPNLLVAYFANNQLKKYLSIATLAMAETMQNSKICIIKAQRSLFVTSDIPVVNIYGEKLGIEYDLMGMPITPDLFLAFIDTDYPVPKVVTVDDSQVKRINGKQDGGARRLLISNSDELLSYVAYSYEQEDDSWLYQMIHMDKETALREYREIMNSKEIKYWK